MNNTESIPQNIENSKQGLSNSVEIHSSIGEGPKDNPARAFTLSRILINWILSIASGFLLLSFSLFFFICSLDKYLELIKILIPIITFLLGVISSLGFVNYKITDKEK